MSVIEGMFIQGYFTDSPPTKAEHIDALLLGEMRRHRGNKRIRKKRAKQALLRQWRFHMLAAPLIRRLNYAEVGQAVFQVQPLPPTHGLPYYGGQ